MAVTVGTELVNNGNSGWTQSDVMDTLEKVFYDLGWNSGTQKNGVPIAELPLIDRWMLQRTSEIVDDIRNYIDYTQKRITHFCQNRKNLKKTYVKFIDKQLEAKDTLMLYYQKLKTITPFSYSLTKFKEIGQIMLYFYNFHTDTTLKNVFLQSFGFHGYLDNVEGLQNHIKERKISFCRFKYYS